LSDPALYKNGHEAVVGIAFNKEGRYHIEAHTSINVGFVTPRELVGALSTAVGMVGGTASLVFVGHGHPAGGLEGPSDDPLYNQNKRMTRQVGDVAAARDTQEAAPFLKGKILLWTESGATVYYFDYPFHWRLK